MFVVTKLADEKRKICGEAARAFVESARNGLLERLRSFTSDASQCFVERCVLELFSDSEIEDLVRTLRDAGYVVLIADGYFCVELPSEKRECGLYVKGDVLKDKYIAAGFEVHDL